MTVLEIAHIGHPILRQRSREVERAELAAPAMQRFIDDLVETMRAANGAGLAAPQVHNPVRICAVEIANNPRYPYMVDWPLTVMVNPVIRPLTPETFDNYEGCLSVPNLRGLVARSTIIELSWWDREGGEQQREVRGLTAGTFQHEIDHLDGKLFVDRVTDTTSLCTWAEFERFHKQAFVDRMVPFIARMGG